MDSRAASQMNTTIRETRTEASVARHPVSIDVKLNMIAASGQHSVKGAWSKRDKMQFSVQDIDNGSVGMMGGEAPHVEAKHSKMPSLNFEESRPEFKPTSYFEKPTD